MDHSGRGMVRVQRTRQCQDAIRKTKQTTLAVYYPEIEKIKGKNQREKSKRKKSSFKETKNKKDASTPFRFTTWSTTGGLGIDS